MKDTGEIYNESNETSEEKQERMNCGVARDVCLWSCYQDCAFFRGNRCTYNDED